MKSDSEIDLFNQRLTDSYGKSVEDNLPNYRVVWTTDQTEYRYSTFEDYVPNTDIYLRTVTETRLVPRYPMYPDMWVLEQLRGNDVHTDLEVKRSYEPLWIFGANNSNPQPIWRAISLLIDSRKLVEAYRESPSDIKDKEHKQFEAERLHFKEVMDNDTPWLARQIKDGEATSVLTDNHEPLVKEPIKEDVKNATS